MEQQKRLFHFLNFMLITLILIGNFILITLFLIGSEAWDKIKDKICE